MPVVVALPYIALAASMAGTAVAANAANQAGKSQQALENYNAQLANQQAATVQSQALVEANVQRAQNAKVLAKERAGAAAAGVVGNTGSPLVQESNDAGTLELKALNTEYKGNIAADQYTQQAQLDTMQGGIARSAGAANATATVLQGTAKAANDYYGLT